MKSRKASPCGIFVARAWCGLKAAVQMLDAAHGEGRGPIGVVQRVHVARVEVQVTRVAVACGIGRRGVDVAVRADIRQGSRRIVAVARSRRSEQSLE